jgi:hypothetical protein
MANKSEIAKTIAKVHRNFEPSISRIIHLVADRDSSDAEPVKLLEVNPDTFESGIWPIHFGADPPLIPFSSVVIEVTEKEFEAICAGTLSLPEGWRLGDTLYPAAA